MKNGLIGDEILRIEISRQGYYGTEPITVKPHSSGEGFEVYLGFKSWYQPTLSAALAFVSEEFKYLELTPLKA